MSTKTKSSTTKLQVIDNPPKRFRSLKFGIQSTQDVLSQGVLEITRQPLYDLENGRVPLSHGALDTRLGLSAKIGKCATCNLPLKSCTGHFGHLRLALPAFHIGYLKFTKSILEQICKDCGTILLSEEGRKSYLKELRRPGLDNMRRTQWIKKINEQCKKTKECFACGSVNGAVKKLGVLKLAHDKFSAFNKSTSQKKVPPESKVKFDASFAEAKKTSPEVEKHIKKALEDLNPLRVLNLFKSISPDDCELLGIDPHEGRPEMFIWQIVPVPPVCIRPSVAQDNASTEDDLTAKVAEIAQVSGNIRASLEKGQSISQIMEMWEFLQVQTALYVNSDVPGLAQPGFGKNVRGLCQRLKGKQGRFRGNLSGKRVDFSGRTVISPDPNLGIDQVAIPVHVAKNLTYPERVNDTNIERMRQLVRNGAEVWPGARFIRKQSKHDSFKHNLKWGELDKVAEELAVDDIVERHLIDGDVVLFNRQPSLHKLSIMSHTVKVRPWRTFRLNECVCTPYNADFDGDEMNLHVPQTEEARAEALTLMGVKHNLATPKNGEPIIAATQDFITAAYLLSAKDRFFDRKSFTYICQHMLLEGEAFDIPPPAILKPAAIWTGKQVMNVLMRPSKTSPVKVNLEAKCREFRPPAAGTAPDMCPNDGWLVIRNSELMCGRMDKSTIGAGKKDSVFYVILRDFGPDAAADAMNRLARLCARQIGERGFSVGVGDVFPVNNLTKLKDELVEAAYRKCDELIEEFKLGQLEKAAGCNMEETLENRISGILSKVRQQAGEQCVDTLSGANAPLSMAKSGAKGSDINVAQMVACVGQQIIGGQRVPDGFQDRSLPHFHKNARQPPSKGFVRNSFYTGLLPTEFLFHAISGREGLVDTAVKTAETGYMSRRLMKSLEDLSTQYDETVRTSAGGVVQFQFGADNLDPVSMEGSGKPVNLNRTWMHAENLSWNNEEASMLPYEMIEVCDDILSTERRRYVRRRLADNAELAYDDTSDRSIDQHDSARRFLREIGAYVEARADALANVRRKAGLFPGDIKTRGPRTTAKLKAQQARVDHVAKITQTTLQKFVRLCLEKYKLAHVEPGHAVGATGAQSIGEPGTQMTLKTFHFAGVAGMSITQGVPRIKEIINASKVISTPVITCPLENDTQLEAARLVKNRIEKAYLEDILDYLEVEWDSRQGTIYLGIDLDALQSTHLGMTVSNIADRIKDFKKLRISWHDITIEPSEIQIRVSNDDPSPPKRRTTATTAKAAAKDAPQADLLLRVNTLRRILPTIPISGYPEATRAIIQTSESSRHTVLVEGYGLQRCMITEGVIGKSTTTNNVMEAANVLGIEAARTTIASEIALVMGEMGIDPRHMQLLADVMTYKGDVLGITRFGLQKMRDSVLQLASFEKTADHLFDAAAGMKSDRIEGVSECIIMGQTMNVGTGGFGMVRRLNVRERDLGQRKCLFEDVWGRVEREEREKRREKGRANGSGNGGEVNGHMDVDVAV